MASEALDIKTLTTLIMATPKTDIEQSVGRILRQKHTNPIVVDIIDQHEPFIRQWYKRRTFYKKHNYRILQTTSTKYTPDTTTWNCASSATVSKAGRPKKTQTIDTRPSVLQTMLTAEKCSAESDSDNDESFDDEKSSSKNTVFTKCLLNLHDD